MKKYQKEFAEFLIDERALQFGRFELKSGRISPYFFNTSAFNSGNTVEKLGYFYAEAILRHLPQCTSVFGPAYKGIPLCLSSAIALTHLSKKDIGYFFDRKEKKAHGDQGLLVGNLENVAGRVRAFPEEPAHRNAELADRADHALHVPGDSQPRQVHHDGGTQARAKVGRAGGEVAVFRGEGHVEDLFQVAVEGVNLPPGRFQAEAGLEELDAQVVFLVDHDRATLVLADENPGPRRGVTKFAADQVTLDQRLFFQIGKRFRIEKISAPHVGHLTEDLFALGQNVPALCRSGTPREGHSGEVASQPDPRAEDYWNGLFALLGQLRCAGLEERFNHAP